MKERVRATSPEGTIHRFPSIRQAAKRLGVRTQTLSGWLRGNPPRELFWRDWRFDLLARPPQCGRPVRATSPDGKSHNFGTVLECCRQLGMSRSAVWRWLNGLREPSGAWSGWSFVYAEVSQ